jgi:hypothetical protein
MGLPNLTTLSVADKIFDDPDAVSSINPIVAQNLRYFRCSDTAGAKWMWKEVSFPELELLVLQDIALEEMSYPYDMEAYFANGHMPPILTPKLHTLALIHCPTAHPQTGPSFLARATAPAIHLIVVDLYERGQENVFNYLLNFPRDKSHLWPNIDTITYKARRAIAQKFWPANYRILVENKSNISKQCKIRRCWWGGRWRGKEYDADVARRDEDWNELCKVGIIEDVPQDENVVPWPTDHNFFSSHAENIFIPRIR